jgi:hypothetical protein
MACSPVRVVMVVIASTANAARRVAVAVMAASPPSGGICGSGAADVSGTGAAPRLLWLLLWVLWRCCGSGPNWRDKSAPEEALPCNFTRDRIFFRGTFRQASIPDTICSGDNGFGKVRVTRLGEMYTVRGTVV